MPAEKVSAVICAAGSSNRMEGVKKEYLPLQSSQENGKPLTVLGAALNAFLSWPEISPIVIAVPPGSENEARAILNEQLLNKGQERVLFVHGGATRRASVHNALYALEPYSPSHVLIHDGARPWVKPGLIKRIIDAAVKYGAAIPALPLTETPKETGTEDSGVKFITRHLRRADLYTAQTPQGFRFRSILDAHEKAVETTLPAEYTDDAEVWGEFAGRVALVAGDPENRKITFPEDLRSGYTESGERKKVIGLGRDLHRLTPGRKFLLGGVEIPFDRGEQGHSDGDVLAHAVIDALLGAAGLGDIGELYSPDDPRWKDADSLELLKNAWTKVQNEGWSLVNLDCVVTCEKPKILPYRETIRRSLAQALGADPRSIFIKGKTNEGLGPLGAGEAVEAMAVCLLEKEGR